MTTTTYRLAPPPPLASMYEWDCVLCGHETLAKPVFLAGASGVIAAGTGCASVALYGRKDASTKTRVRNAAASLAIKAEREEEARQERRTRYAAALEAFRADVDYTPGLQSTRQAYAATVKAWGGHRMTFPAFLALVAETGEIPE